MIILLIEKDKNSIFERNQNHNNDERVLCHTSPLSKVASMIAKYRQQMCLSVFFSTYWLMALHPMLCHNNLDDRSSLLIVPHPRYSIQVLLEPKAGVSQSVLEAAFILLAELGRQHHHLLASYDSLVLQSAAPCGRIELLFAFGITLLGLVFSVCLPLLEIEAFERSLGPAVMAYCADILSSTATTATITDQAKSGKTPRKSKEAPRATQTYTLAEIHTTVSFLSIVASKCRNITTRTPSNTIARLTTAATALFADLTRDVSVCSATRRCVWSWV
jgi:hypothetical protein